MDVVVDVHVGASAVALGSAMSDALGGAPTGSVWLADEPLPLAAPIGSSGLRDGCSVGLGAPAPVAPADLSGRQLQVVGGPDAGLSCPLPDGDLLVGRGTPALPLTDVLVPARALAARASTHGVVVEDLTGAARLDGEPFTTASLLPGQLLRVGDTLLALASPGPPDAALAPDGSGGLSCNRPPRLRLPEREVVVELPAEPVAPEQRGFPVLAVLLPLAFGVGLAAVLGRATYLLFALLSPVLLAATHVSDRRRGRQTAGQRQRAYEEATAQAYDRLEQARQAETQRRRAQSPDLAELLAVAAGPRARLWERRGGDADALHLRVGVADLPARARLVRAGQPRVPADPVLVREVPAVLELRELGVVGVAGPPPAVRSSTRAMLAQVAVLHSPRDVRVVVLTGRAAGADWDWLRWLPHARAAVDDPSLVLVGNDSRSTAQRVAELAALVRERSAALAGAGSSPHHDRRASPDVVVVVDGAQALRQLPGLSYVLEDGPAAGVLAVCLDSHRQLLPQQCRATVEVHQGRPSRATVRRDAADVVGDVLLDGLAPQRAEQIARCLSPLRDPGTDDGQTGLPAAVRLLDLLGTDPPSSATVAQAWRDGDRSPRALVGVGSDGPVLVDLARDGPHGLVAGTTGSGKSELLQTLVASLAVTHRPDELSFLLVDYKGGSAFSACARLPHVTGLVTDLDPHLVQRALVSLRAELRGRERSLADAGVPDLDAHVRARAARPDLPPLPRLVIVVDEFAALARELPDFVPGLVDVAQRGRSLGIHLLLATQRPAGVVSPEIRANTGLRLALRVTDPAESTDVLGVPDAARIPVASPGRALARLEHGTLVAFQTARVGGRRRTAGEAVGPPAVLAVPWSQLGTAAQLPTTARPEEPEDTDLDVLVEAVCAAADELAVAAPPPPWLPPLPEALVLDRLPAGPAGVTGLQPAPYALEDLPERQQQRTAVFDLAADGHLFAVGGARTGRTQMLRTLAASLAGRHGCDQVHLYALDCGSGGLQPLAALPHCGAVVTRAEPERAARLLGRLTAELTRRQSQLASAGCSGIEELRARLPVDQRPAHLVLLLDRWEGFCDALGETDGGTLHDVVLSLLREGPAAGVHLVMTGDRSLLLGRVGATTEDRIAFRLTDPADAALLGLPFRAVPTHLPAGRAVRAGSGTSLQVALLAEDPAGPVQSAALTDLAGRCTARDAGVDPGRRPLRVDVLPDRVDLATAAALRPRHADGLHAWLGVGGDELALVGCSLSGSTPSFVVGGPPRSGRSTALVALAEGLLAQGCGLVLVAPRPSPLRGLAARDGVHRTFTGSDLSEDDLAESLAHDGPLAVLLDDADLLRDCGAGRLLRRLVHGVTGPPRAVLLAGRTDELCTGLSGWVADVRRARQGALLSPQGLADGDLLGLRLPRSAVGAPVTPGRALVHAGDGRLVTVQVPVA